MKDDLKRVNTRLDVLMKELSALKAAHRDLKKKFDLYRTRSWISRLLGV